MLAAGASKSHHQVLESAALVFIDTGVHQRQSAGKELVHALLLIEVFDYRGIHPGERFKSLFAPGIGQAAAVENESSSIASFVLRPAPVKRKAENPYREVLRTRGKPLQLFGSEHAVEGIQEGWQRDGQLHIVKKPAQVFQRVRNALQKMRLPLIETAESVRAQRLHNAHIDKSVVVAEERIPIDRHEARQLLEVVVEQVLA